MKRWDIINHLIEKSNYKSYLEIGVQGGECFSKVMCDNKIGVDHDHRSKANVFTTSDEFFRNNTQKFDIIFIDGLHESPQVYRDILNSLDVLYDGGCIICHDMLPISEEMQRVPRVSPAWTGDCWKAWIRLRDERKDLDMFVIDIDYGIGLIKKKNITQELTYSDFQENKKLLMNIITVEDFLNS